MRTMSIDFTFKTTWRSDQDDWHSDGPAITNSEVLKRIHDALEDRILVLEHWHYRGSRAPDRIVVDDYDNFIEYLKVMFRTYSATKLAHQAA